jgi:hypothetical protein
MPGVKTPSKPFAQPPYGNLGYAADRLPNQGNSVLSYRPLMSRICAQYLQIKCKPRKCASPAGHPGLEGHDHLLDV